MLKDSFVLNVEDEYWILHDIYIPNLWDLFLKITTSYLDSYSNIRGRKFYTYGQLLILINNHGITIQITVLNVVYHAYVKMILSHS